MWPGAIKFNLPAGIVLAATVAYAAPPPGYALVWSDEFNGSSLNTANWEYARNGWRNSP